MTKGASRVSTTPDGWNATEQILGVEFRRRRQKLIQLISKIMQDQENAGGSFILADDQPYMLDGLDKRVYRIDFRDSKFMMLLAYRYGLERGEPVTKSLVTMLEATARARGAHAEVHRFSWWDEQERVLYLSRYDGTMWRLDGEKFEVISNGKGVLFLDDDDAESAGDVDPTPTASGTPPDGRMLAQLVDDLSWRQADTGLTPEIQRSLFAVWIHAVAFQSMMKTKPILLMEGEKGSGKSAAIQRVQLALTGREFLLVVADNEEDFAVQLLRSPIACLDNLDANKPWLRDAICTYASSGGWRKRKRYSDVEQVIVRPETLIAVTSRNPTTFRRDDVADRCVVLRLERRTDFAGSEMFDMVRANRGSIYAEWLWRLNRTVAKLRTTPPARAVDRLAGFAQVAYAAGVGSLGATTEQVTGWLAAASGEREALTLEADLLVVALDLWLPQNKGVSLTAVELHSALARVSSEASPGTAFYANGRALASRLTNIRPALEHRYGVRIERSVSHGGAFRYRFLPADE